jgi:Flp pilus assembly protein TadG
MMGLQDQRLAARLAGFRSAARAARAQLTAGHLAARGQMLVLFVVSIFVLTGITAIVVDVSWYWANSLRVQRAADAAALAGVVWLPGNPTTAYSTARAEATKNGYTGGGGVTVTPLKDGANSRRLSVTISAPVGTFFMKIFGMNAINATRTGKAEFVLPVPMGSPQNYYGVGFFEGQTGGPITSDGPRAPTWSQTTNPYDDFTNEDRAWSSNNQYATGIVGTGTNGDTQAYGNFGFNVGSGLAIKGIEIRVEAKASDPVGCQLAVELSWDNGVTYTATGKKVTLTGSDPVAGSWPIVGGSADTWGRAWTPAELANGQLRVRLRALDPEAADDATNSSNLRCNNAATVSVDAFNVTVYTQGKVNQTLPVPNPAGGAPLVPQNIWGAIFTSGGLRENGDRYAPSNIGGGLGLPAGDPNPDYDANGYDYTVELSGGATNGQVRLFDPIFCATGGNGHGGSYGAGDHWTDIPGGTTIRPVAVTYRLYDMHNTPLDPSDDGAPVATLNYDPGTKTLGDFSGSFGTPQNSADANRQDCSANPAHNAWVTLKTGLLGGMYRVNVNTTLDAGNASVGAENLFSIWVGSTGGVARVYGAGRMAAYANLAAGTGVFYLCQIEAVHAGKTMTINLFDPGESNGNAFLRILSPDGSSYDYARFDWSSDDGRSGNDVTEIQTSNGSPLFNNHLITIDIPLPATYGSGGLTPAGETEPGWWKIEYEMSAANDTTTWEVSINGNPVHLIIP